MRRRSSKLIRGLAILLASLIRPLAVLVMFAGRILPERIALRAAWLFGAVARMGKRQEILARLHQVTGEENSTPETDAKFWCAHQLHVGRTLLEPIYFFDLPDAELVARISLVGGEHLQRALGQGHGVVLFFNHLGNPAATIAGLGLRGFDPTVAGNAMDITIAGETAPLKHLEAQVQRMFARCRARRALLGDRLPQRLSETLSRNGLFGMFIDFPVVGKHNELIPFGGARLNVNLGPAILALRHRAPVLGVSCLRVGANRHQLTVHPALELPVDGDKTAAARLMEAALAQLLPDLRRDPEQWWSWDWAKITPGN